MAIRAQCAIEALQDVCQWLENGGEVAVFDATNSTLDRRRLIQNFVVNKMGFKLFFVESVSNQIKETLCNGEKVILSKPSTEINKKCSMLFDRRFVMTRP